MLNFLRKNTKTIVWTVVIAFIAWGGFAVRVQFEESNRSPGRIFGKEVSFHDYLLASQFIGILHSPNAAAEPPHPQEIEANTWQFLILSHEARHRRIQVSDEEVRSEIARLFSGGKGFQLAKEQYVSWVRSVFHHEPREFENQVREHLRVQKILNEVRREGKEKPEEYLKGWLGDLMARAKPEIYPPRS